VRRWAGGDNRAFECLCARPVGQKRVELGKELCLLTAALALAIGLGFHHLVRSQQVLSRESKYHPERAIQRALRKRKHKRRRKPPPYARGRAAANLGTCRRVALLTLFALSKSPIRCP
jgi:hypothetical protein